MLVMYEINMIVTATLWIVIVFIYPFSTSASVFNPITFYLFFHGLVFVVRPIFKYLYDFQSMYSLYSFFPSEETRNLALIAANIGLISFCAGCYCTGNVRMRFAGAQLRDSEQAKTFRWGLLSALIIAAPWIAASFKLNMSANFTDVDLLNMTADASTGATLYTDTTGYVADANLMLGAFGVGLIWAFRFKWYAWIPYLIFCILRMSIGWGRFSFMLTLGSVAVIYSFYQGRKWISLRMMAGAVAVIPLFSAIGAERTLIADWITGREREVPVWQKNEIAPKHFFDQMDFAALECLEYMIDVVPEKTKSFDYFLDNLEIFTAPVPRMLWRDKPVGPPIKLFNVFDYGTPIGIAWTVIGEGWQALGVVGVVIWCFLGGAGWGWLYRLFALSAQTPWQVLAYTLILPLSVQWFRDGVLITLLKFPLFFLLPVVLSRILGPPLVSLYRDTVLLRSYPKT